MENKKFVFNNTEYNLEEVDWLPSTVPFDENTPLIKFGGKVYLGKAIPKQSSIPLDYEILKCDSDVMGIHDYTENSHCPCSRENYKFCKIHSVRRISDGEVFSVGDKRPEGEILKITYEEENGLHIWTKKPLGGKPIEYPYKVSELKKVTVPLFTTEDGKPLFEEDSFWFILHDNTVGRGIARKTNDWSGHIFSTEDAAKEYILMNKPLLSLNDLLENWDECYYGNNEVYKSAPMFKRFQNAAKKKINV